jgi:hypothetical protein
VKVKSRRLASREKRKTNKRKKGKKRRDKREVRKDGGRRKRTVSQQRIENPKKSSGPTKDISQVY